MIRYHDEEWGVPVHHDSTLFEFLILEGAQAGLSWETILNKRENYRAAFDGFDAQRVARYDRRKVAQLLKNPGIVRNRLEDRIDSEKCPGIAASAKRIRQLRSLRLAICEWPAAGEFVESARSTSCAHCRIRRYEQSPEEARLHLRGIDHLLRLHASRRHGERSRSAMLPPRRGRRRKLDLATSGGRFRDFEKLDFATSSN